VRLVTDLDADKELLAAIAQGDRRALRELYTSYHSRLFRFLMRVTHDTELTEEIFNDTMWVVWRNAASFRAESRVSTWVTGIAYRRALKSLASNRRQQAPLGISLDADTEGSEDLATVPSFVDAMETRDWIDTALGQLSPEHRMTLELAYFMGESCESIAEITDCPVGTVKTRLHHARMRMQRHLATASERAGSGEGN
jgi:RNA polymerase sigma-70 factor, ECF subfamily